MDPQGIKSHHGWPNVLKKEVATILLYNKLEKNWKKIKEKFKNLKCHYKIGPNLKNNVKMYYIYIYVMVYVIY